MARDNVLLSDAVHPANALLDPHRVPRHVEVDDDVAELQVQTFTTGIRRNQHAHIFENTCCCPRARLQVHAAVERRHRETTALQVVGQHRLRRHELGEDQHLQRRVAFLLAAACRSAPAVPQPCIGASGLRFHAPAPAASRLRTSPAPSRWTASPDPPGTGRRGPPTVRRWCSRTGWPAAGGASSRAWRFSSVVRMAAVLDVTSRCIRIIKKPMGAAWPPSPGCSRGAHSRSPPRIGAAASRGGRQATACSRSTRGEQRLAVGVDRCAHGR